MKGKLHNIFMTKVLQLNNFLFINLQVVWNKVKCKDCGNDLHALKFCFWNFGFYLGWNTNLWSIKIIAQIIYFKLILGNDWGICVDLASYFLGLPAFFFCFFNDYFLSSFSHCYNYFYFVETKRSSENNTSRT